PPTLSRPRSETPHIAAPNWSRRISRYVNCIRPPKERAHEQRASVPLDDGGAGPPCVDVSRRARGVRPHALGRVAEQVAAGGWAEGIRGWDVEGGGRPAHVSDRTCRTALSRHRRDSYPVRRGGLARGAVARRSFQPCC